MSDEIEIEEHDLLDDPTVRNIFPDISRLKQEILDFDYVEAPDFENTSTQSDSNDDNGTGSSVDREETKINLLDNFEHTPRNDGPHNGFIRRDKGIEMKICNNKIILGSKPILPVDSNVEHFEKNVKPYCAVVMLEDFGIYLNNSSRYCQHCHILFPTNVDYDHHEKNIHKELVVYNDSVDSVDNTDIVDDEMMVRKEYIDGDKLIIQVNKKNDLIIQENKKNETIHNSANEHEDDQRKKFLKFGINGETAFCLICNAQLNFRRNISKHLMQVHKISKDKIGEIMGNKKSIPQPREELTSIPKRNECFHCKKIFRSQNLLIEHIYSILQTPKSGSDMYVNKILIGNKTNNEQNSAITPENRNLNSIHIDGTNMANTNVEDHSTTKHLMKFFKCRFCVLYFKTTKFFLRHMTNKHKMVKNVQMAKVIFDPKCKHCTKVCDNVKYYNVHVYKYHRHKIQEAIERSQKLLFCSKGERNLVSKENAQNVFYRCAFCFLYFNNMTFFVRHVTNKHKVMKMPKPKKVAFDPKCKYCSGVYPNVKRYNIHLQRIHPVICNQVVGKSTSTNAGERESNIDADADNVFYRCKICPLYFKNIKWFIRHLTNKHKIKNIPKMEKQIFNPKCKYCPQKIDNVRKYNDHLTKTHAALLDQVVERSEPATVTKKIKVNMKPKLSKLNKSNIGETFECYRCKFCPSFFKTMKFYRRHVKIRHNRQVDKVSKQKMVKFDPKCRFCPALFHTIKLYNTHIYKHHQGEVARKPNLENQDSDHNMVTTKTGVDMKGKSLYRCCYCSYYFYHIGVYKSHIIKKHKVKLARDAKKTKFDSHCKYCYTKAVSVKAYNCHLSKCHKNIINEVFTGRIKEMTHMNKAGVAKSPFSSSTAKSLQESRNPSKQDDNVANLNSNIMPLLKSALFKCNKCDIHFLTIKSASDHLNHMELLVNWKCSLCNKIFKENDRWLHEKQHLSSHVFTVYDLNTANTSHILYKCSKCNLHYDESVDNHHNQCISKIPQSYTCEICKILIDCSSKICHEYNHKHRDLTSNDFIVIESGVILVGNINNIRPDKLNPQIDVDNLTDDNQVERNKQTNNLKRKISKAQVQTKKIKKKYEGCSKNKLQDIVYNENYSNVVTPNQQKFDKLLLKLSFCGSCKSFVSILGQKRKEHAQKLCANLPTLVCKDCGLRFSCKTLSTHRQVHLRIKNLKLQNFKFYNFNSGKRVMPPMPEYEKCGICETNFISKSTLGQHVCSDNEYKLCSICNIKLFTPVFNLHMAFHNYKNDETSSRSTTNNTVVSETKEAIQNPNKNNLLILYCCKICNLNMDTYDRLIEHCHNHCLDTLSKYPEECKICKLKFDDSSLKTHGKVHEMLGVPAFDKLFFDPFYFRFDNKVWLNHVFGSHPKIKVQDIILTSRYRDEHRFIMHIVQEGRFDLTLYKCDKCNLYVEPDVIYHHIENSCSSLRRYPCPVCHLDFISSFLLTKHKRTHEDPKVTLKSYRIVHFNRQEDADLNAAIFSPPKLYVIYQCRHCNGIVDSMHRMSHVCDENSLKSCADCGLWITEDVYEHHISKHKNLDSFMAENIKVILFGEYELHDKKLNSVLAPTFRGKIHDYSFYKCRNCYVCVKHKKSTLTHCCYKGPRVSCSKCGLYFNADKLVSHTKTHAMDSDFILDNMNIIEFNPTVHKAEEIESMEIARTSNNESSSEIECVDVNENVNEANHKLNVSHEKSLPVNNTTEANAEVDNIADIYKCSCGLHFIDETSVLEHISQCGSKAKQAKQNCSKCGLLFTPTVLFKHLLSHHGDKLINYKFNIIEKSNDT